MKQRVNLLDKSYDIIIEKGSLQNIFEYVEKISKNFKKVFIVTDTNVDKYYGETLLNIFKEKGIKTYKHVFTAGEESKNINTLAKIYKSMSEFSLRRDDIVIALGGGVVGDITGFASSSYLRGVKYVMIPTSLLSQVDSSVGGKTAIDIPEGKNLVGAFYQPSLVVIDPLTLNTLEKRYIIDGFGEIIKYSMIKDKNLYENLVKFSNIETAMENIEYIIDTCINIKREIVEEDEMDTSIRMILNFGHTFGHALEVFYDFKKYSHGEAVSIGMSKITKKSEEMKLTKEGTHQKLNDLLKKYSLPQNDNNIESEKIIEKVLLDKKIESNTINLILIKEIGESFIHKVNINEIKSYMI